MVAEHGALGSTRRSGGVRRVYRAVAGLLPPVPRFRVQRTLTLARRGVRGAAGRLAGSSGALMELPGAERGWRRSQDVVMLVAVGVDADGLVAVLEDVAAVTDGHRRTLYVTDCDAFHELRERGLLFEYIPPRQDWERHIGGSYDAFLARRLRTITGTYRPARVVVHPAGAPLADGLLAGLLAPADGGTGAERG
jgi:hypothetical protein